MKQAAWAEDHAAVAALADVGVLCELCWLMTWAWAWPAARTEISAAKARVAMRIMMELQKVSRRTVSVAQG